MSRMGVLAEGEERDQKHSPFFEHTRVGNVARVEIRVPVGAARPDPMVLRCPCPDMLRGDPRCEAPGATSAALPASRWSAARGDVEG
jgi:hypothetical protein